MSRRRYVSTDISVDTRVNKLAEESGDFAALLYTWMIPHADDLGELSADLEQLMFTVIPGRRSVTLCDVQRATEAMVALGLIELDSERGKLKYPPKSFYRYQTYVNENRRESAQNSAEQRTSAQNATSFSFSSSFPVKSPVSRSAPSRGGAREKSRRFTQNDKKRVETFVARLAELKIDHNPTREDMAEIVDSPEEPETIADAFATAFTGKWDNKFVRENLQVRFVVQNIAGYKAALARGFAKNGKTASGALTREEQDAKYGIDDEAQIEHARGLIERRKAEKQKRGTPHEPTKQTDRTTGGTIATDRCNLANGARNEHTGTNEIRPGDDINGPPIAASVHRASVS